MGKGLGTKESMSKDYLHAVPTPFFYEVTTIALSKDYNALVTSSARRNSLR